MAAQLDSGSCAALLRLWLSKRVEPLRMIAYAIVLVALSGGVAWPKSSCAPANTLQEALLSARRILKDEASSSSGGLLGSAGR